MTDMHWIVREVKKSDAKLILIGDSGQLSSIGIPGAFEKIAKIFGSSKLYEVKRQNNIAHREASMLIADFKLSEAIDIYRREGGFKFGRNIAETISSLVDDYVESYLDRGKKIIALAYRNIDVTKLNDDIREALRIKGVIKKKEVIFKNKSGKELGIL
jgi:ATP-dependent exoDNAse (exonuclease V) alpha subunit